MGCFLAVHAVIEKSADQWRRFLRNSISLEPILRPLIGLEFEKFALKKSFFFFFFFFYGKVGAIYVALQVNGDV